MVTTRITVHHRLIADTHYSFVTPVLAVPLLAVLAMTWLASWHGSGRVLSVRPMEALDVTQRTREIGLLRAVGLTAANRRRRCSPKRRC
ncbi:MAG TPA: hypothetical protein VF053_14560 [Streptosporangiales bacterium]